MAASNTPIFVAQRFCWTVTLTSQVLSLDGGTGAGSLLGTASGAGALIESIWFEPLGSVSGNVIRIFRLKAGATVPQLVRAIDFSALSGATATAAQFSTPTEYANATLSLPEILTPVGSYGLPLGNGDSLYAALGTASGTGINVVAIGGHYESGTGTA